LTPTGFEGPTLVHFRLSFASWNKGLLRLPPLKGSHGGLGIAETAKRASSRGMFQGQESLRASTTVSSLFQLLFFAHSSLVGCS
jgi:hypothetical protein